MSDTKEINEATEVVEWMNRKFGGPGKFDLHFDQGGAPEIVYRYDSGMQIILWAREIHGETITVPALYRRAMEVGEAVESIRGFISQTYTCGADNYEDHGMGYKIEDTPFPEWTTESKTNPLKNA